MPVLFVFLLKVNIALLLFCAGYYLVLRHLTFYTLNRVYLLAAILFASVYPEINLLPFLQNHEALAKPMEQVVINWQLPAQGLTNSPDYWHWAEIIFWLGAYVLAIRLAIQLFSLYQLYKSSKPAVINDHQVRVTDKDTAPFSFWQSIFVNPAKHEPVDLKAILLHEQVHVNQWHTADILLAELSTIFYWFNPGIWLIKRAIKENVEFITDRKILSKGIDSKTYQYSLLSVSLNHTGHSIVNHFNLSTIKKRIIMMNAKRSSRINLTRYAFMVPVLIALLLVFSISKADFAKPIRVKLIYSAPALAKIMHVNNDESIAAKPVIAKTKMATSKVTTLKAIQKVDTVKKVVTTNKRHMDSVITYIDGTKGDLNKIDPNSIETVDISKGDTYADGNKSKNIGIIRVITKDSVKRIRISPKIAISNKVSANSQVTNNINSNVSVNNQVNVQPVITHTVTGTYPKVIMIDSIKSVKGNGRISEVIVTTDGKKVETLGVSSNDKGVNITNSEGNKPLILVDDKEMSEADLKKIDPKTIESMNVFKNEEPSLVKKYGEKAKDGVIIIKTKKAKN
ncbi:MAG: M56 family metallopeptidase [Mucilaginibacter sp.]|uniref:M56 family metallopeptidase n=1 Tax=Mucilaginibacter sp. TaxID=1882438 RepID=UPI0031ABD449